MLKSEQRMALGVECTVVVKVGSARSKRTVELIGIPILVQIYTASRLVLRAGTQGGWYLLGERRADDAAEACS